MQLFEQGNERTCEIESLPVVRFAHVHSAESYSSAFFERKDCIEISYISEGEVEIGVEGKRYTAGKGDVTCLMFRENEITVRAGAYHSHHTVSADVIWVQKDHLKGLFLPPVTPMHLGTKAAQNIIDQLIRNQLLFKESPARGASLFMDLLCEIDHINRRGKMLYLPSEVLYARRAKEYVQEHIRSPITQKAVAEQLAITPEYLCSVFKKSEGITFIQYVNAEKLEAIKTLMEKERVHLYEASALYGYSDPNYVSRLFKKYYGYCLTEKPLQR